MKKKQQSKIHSLREGQNSLPGFNALSGQGEDVMASPASGEELQLVGTVRKSAPDAKQAANRTPQLLPETMGQDPKDAGDTRRTGTGRSKHVIASRTEFAHLVFELRCSLEDHPERWPNGSLLSFLDALATFVVEGGDDRYRLPEWTDWETFSEILLAAKTYGS